MSRPSKTTLPGGQLVQPHEAAPERRLAAAGLADEAERLAGAHLERDAVDGLHARDLAADHAAALDREVLRDVAQPRAAARRSRRQLRMDRRLAPRELLGHRQEAAVAVTGRRALLERRLLGAGREDVRAARRERAARRQREQRGRQARDRRQAVRLGTVDARDRAQQPPGVGVLRVREQLALGAVLDDAARRTSRRRGRRCRRRRPCRA